MPQLGRVARCLERLKRYLESPPVEVIKKPLFLLGSIIKETLFVLALLTAGILYWLKTGVVAIARRCGGLLLFRCASTACQTFVL